MAILCRVMQVSRSAYYAWLKRPEKLITADELNLYRRAKALFMTSRNSLGSLELSKKLREEGFLIGRYRTRTLMRQLRLKVQQRVKYKVTTKRKHSDRGSQYTSRHYRKLLADHDIRASRGDVGACWDNAVVERFFGGLKHDWVLKVAQPTREHMKQDVVDYIRYYNNDRLHTANNSMSPVNYELSEIKVSR